MIQIRSWCEADAVSLAQMLNNKNILANLRDGIPFPYTVQDAMCFLSHTAIPNSGSYFCIEAGGQVAGSICILAKENIYRKTAEIGYYVAEPYWKRGIATRAIALITDHAWKNLDIVKIYAEVFSFNIPSMRALEKNGYMLESVRKKHVIKNGQFWDDCVWVKFRSGFLDV